MLEAEITKAVIVEDPKTQGTILMAVAEYGDECVNIRVPYDWVTLDQEGFIEDLREKLAKEFDLNVYRVNVKANKLLDKMALYHYEYRQRNA